MRTLSLFYEQWLGKLPLGELERVSLMFDIGEIHRDSYSRLKRLIDVVLAVVCLPALLVLIPFVMIANLAGNRGRLLFKQQRVGKTGKVFTIWKFRTMRDVPGAATHWTSDDDPRITPSGPRPAIDPPRRAPAADQRRCRATSRSWGHARSSPPTSAS